MGAEITLTELILASTAAAAGGVALSSEMNKGGSLKPGVAAADNKKTAEALPQASETAKKNKRFATQMLTKDFQAPTLGQPGLLGI